MLPSMTETEKPPQSDVRRLRRFFSMNNLKKTLFVLYYASDICAFFVV